MLHLRDLNIDNLLTVCRALPQEEFDLWRIMTGVEHTPESLAIGLSSSTGWIIHNGDQPLAAAGYTRQRPGVWRTWMAATDLAWEPYGRETTRIVRDNIAKVLSEGIAHRVETVTLADRKRARDWYPKIGLQHESTLRGYGINGEDAVIYVALRDAETK